MLSDVRIAGLTELEEPPKDVLVDADEVELEETITPLTQALAGITNKFCSVQSISVALSVNSVFRRPPPEQ